MGSELLNIITIRMTLQEMSPGLPQCRQKSTGHNKLGLAPQRQHRRPQSQSYVKTASFKNDWQKGEQRMDGAQKMSKPENGRHTGGFSPFKYNAGAFFMPVAGDQI